MASLLLFLLCAFALASLTYILCDNRNKSGERLTAPCLAKVDP
jgi:hypothetical protein